MIRMLPTELTLQHWAAAGELQHVQAALEFIEQGIASVELSYSLEALNLRVGVLQLFVQASQELDLLDATRPEVIRHGTATVHLENARTIPMEASVYAGQIQGYVQGLCDGAMEVFRPVDDAEPDGRLRYVRQGLTAATVMDHMRELTATGWQATAIAAELRRAISWLEGDGQD